MSVAKYEITGANGEVYDVDGPDDADPSALVAHLSASAASAPTAPPPDAAATPFGRALAKREEDVAAYQAQRQQDYMRQQDYAKQMEQQYPGFFPRDISREGEEAPALDPYLQHRIPPEAPREKDKTEMGSGFSATAKMGLVEDPEVRRRILAATLFPNDPDAYGRVGFDAQGTPVYVGDDNKLHKIAGGLESFAARTLANSPELIGGTAGAELGPLGAGATAGAAHFLKRQIAGAIFGEKYDPKSYLESTGREAGAALLGGVQGKLMTGIADSGKLIEPIKDLPALEAKREAIRTATGVNLSLPQLTDNRQLIGMHAALARGFGPGADVLQAFDKAAKGDFANATQDVLTAIKKQPSTGDYAGREGINVAKETLRQARRGAQRRVDPTYEAAYAEAPIVTDPNILSYFRFPQFRQAMRDGQRIAALEEKEAPTITIRRPRPRQPQPGDMAMEANEVPQMSVRPISEPPAPAAKPPGIGVEQNRIGYESTPQEPGTDLVEVPVQRTLPANRERTGIPGVQRKYERVKQPNGTYRMKEVDMDETSVQVPDLRSLDYTKRALDDQIDKLYKAGDKHEADALRSQANAFTAELDKLAPSYPKARAQWTAELEQNVMPLERGLIGTLARFDDRHAERAAAALFDNPKLNDSMVSSAKSVISRTEGGPKAWDDLVQTWVADHWDKAQTATQTSTEMNAAGRMHQAMYGSPETRAATKAMLGDDAAKAMESLMQAAEGIKRTPIAGSNTARDMQMNETLGGLSGAGLRFVRAIASPRQTMERWAEKRAVQKNGLALARAFTDPAHRQELKIIMKMKPSTRRNVLMFNVVGDYLAKDAAFSDMGPNTQLIAGEEGAVGQ